MKKEFKSVLTVLGVITGIAAVVAPVIVLVRHFIKKNASAES